MRVHITATIMPTPAQLRAGIEPTKHQLECDANNAADQCRTLLAVAIGEGVFEAAGSVVLLVQPNYARARN